jgi:hypothetical protein
MLPAHQRFDRDDLLAIDLVARLIVEDEFVVFERMAQVIFHLPARLDLVAHVRFEIAPGVFAFGLGLIQRDVGVADQFTGHVTVATAEGEMPMLAPMYSG